MSGPGVASSPGDTDDLLFPTTLQTHTHPSAARHSYRGTADDFELSLKAAALLTRGVVISDSDLNNNAMLYEQAVPGRAFLSGITSGFIRRAVRTIDGGPAAQAQVAETLRDNNPERFDSIPAGHVQALDDAFAAAESRPETPPLLWTFNQLGTMFTYRLIKILDDEAQACAPYEPRRRLLHELGDWIRRRLDDGLPVTAAGLEADNRPRWAADMARDGAWLAVWPLVLNAYNGNVPAALDITIGEPFTDPSRFLPAGPDSGGRERSTEMALYGLSTKNALDRFSVERIPMLLPEILRRIRFDERRLAELDLERLIELREAAEPDEFFRVRHTSLGSAQLLEEHLDRFFEAAGAYIERLMSTSGVLTRSAERSAFTAALGGAGSNLEMAAYYLRSSDPDFLADQLMMCITDNPFVPPRVAMCDLELLTRMRPELDQVIERQDGITVLSVARPDYRVIKEFGEHLAGDDES